MTLPEQEVCHGVDDEDFVCAEEEFHSLNQSATELGISPIKKPWSVKSSPRQYLARKCKEITTSVGECTKRKLTKIFKIEIPSAEETKPIQNCLTCQDFISNINSAVELCASYNEKVQVLTLIPESLSKAQILHHIPSATKYMVDKTRNVRSAKGIFGKPDPYTGHSLNEANIHLIQSFYLEDKWDCSRQSANKKDTITVTVAGEKVVKVKRYMTRSIKETFALYKKEHSIFHIGRSKFYALRPKWVVPHPPRDVCLCVYCANFELCIITLKNLLDGVSYDTLAGCVRSLVVCDVERETCLFQECGECPGKGGLSVQTLGLENIAQDSAEVTYATWEENKLIKKTVDIDTFIDEVGKWTVKAVTHQHLKKLQQQHIAEVKACVKAEQLCLVLHCDFAENWSVILPQEIQGYHWSNDQVSIFTGVTYVQNKTSSVAVISDDRGHDSAHALLAMSKIIQKLQTQAQKITIISDGAPSHFKNRYQLFELTKSPVPIEWVFSATGHGKGPCDGIGGLLKHHATKHNLSSPSTAAIQNAKDFTAAVKSYTSIALILLPKEEVETFRKQKLNEWSTQTMPVKGIQKTHVWTHSDGRTYIAKTLNSTKEEISFVQRKCQEQNQNIEMHKLQRGMFVACVYDHDWWVAEIIDISSELKEIVVNFMLPHGPSAGYRFPSARQQHHHQCSLPICDILKVVGTPVPIGSIGRYHSISKEDTDAVQQIFSSLNS